MRSRWIRACGGSVLGAAFALPATAQFPDVLSDSECAGCAARLEAASLEGIWSSALTAATESGWALADYFCFAACTNEGRASAERLLAAPESAHRPAVELYPHAVAENISSVEQLSAVAAGPSRPPAFSCEQSGFAAQVVSALPLKIDVERDRVRLRYEEFSVVRTVPLVDHRASSYGDAAFGASRGRFEDGVLVVETRGIAAGRLSQWLGGFAHGNGLRAIERYAVSTDGRWLDLELTLEDPATFAKPLVVTKRWLRTPRARILQHRCDVLAAGLGGVFAEYLDPRIVDERRP